ncbi:MAG: 50S ribosomal protein L22 [Anaerolineales bacterium]|jgi:large subunit ribosomal protein L22|nr:50S ribosomal protein L22 [Anaerolineales bacterium]HJO33259.1 50S ribosomal protein L22 [Anaerolineales bacterium]
MQDEQFSVAIAKRLPGSAQKARLVADLVRGELVSDALTRLRFMPNAAAGTITKVLESAVAGAETNLGWVGEDLFIHSIMVDEGPSRRWRRFGARGRFKPIKRRTAHIKVALGQIED